MQITGEIESRIAVISTVSARSGHFVPQFFESGLIEMSVWAVRSFHVFGQKLVEHVFYHSNSSLFETPSEIQIICYLTRPIMTNKLNQSN